MEVSFSPEEEVALKLKFAAPLPYHCVFITFDSLTSRKLLCILYHEGSISSTGLPFIWLKDLHLLHLCIITPSPRLSSSWNSNWLTWTGFGENFSTAQLSFPLHPLIKSHLKYECSIIKVNISNAENSENYKNKEKRIIYDLTTQKYYFVLFPSNLPVQRFLLLLFI